MSRVTPVTFFVPGKPRGKGRPRVSTRGGFARMHTDAKTVAYEREIADAARGAFGERAKLDGPIRLDVVATFVVPISWPKRYHAAAAAGLMPHLSVPDWDNIGKVVADAINGLVWIDDSFVTVGSVAKRYGREEGLDVRIVDVGFDGMILPPISDRISASKPRAKTKPAPLLALADERRVR